jgi:trimethylamine corrinoid protein
MIKPTKAVHTGTLLSLIRSLIPNSEVEKMSAELDTIVAAINEFDPDKVKQASLAALEANIPVADVIQKGIAIGLQGIGHKFETGELFLTHLIAAAEAAKAAIDKVLIPEMKKHPDEVSLGTKIILATVKGDVHDIGKNIVGAMLFAAGFNVIDLGKDVPTDEIISKVKEEKAPLLGLSALLSTTIPVIEEVIQALQDAGIRDEVKVIVGGAPVTEEWAGKIGADGYGDNAPHAVAVAKSVLGLK